MEVDGGLPQSPKVKRKKIEVDEEYERLFVSQVDEQSITQDQVVHKNIFSLLHVSDNTG